MYAHLVRWSCGARGRVPRFAHRRVMEFFRPTRASSCHHGSIPVPAGSPSWIASSSAGSPSFEVIDGQPVLRVVARAGRDLPVAERPQLAAHRGLAERDAELLPYPLREIGQTPAHHLVDRRDRAALDDGGQRLTLGIVKLGRVARRLAVDQPGRPPGVEAQHPPLAFASKRCRAASRGSSATRPRRPAPHQRGPPRRGSPRAREAGAPAPRPSCPWRAFAEQARQNHPEARSQQPWRTSLWFAPSIQTFTILGIPCVSPHQRALVSDPTLHADPHDRRHPARRGGAKRRAEPENRAAAAQDAKRPASGKPGAAHPPFCLPIPF